MRISTEFQYSQYSMNIENALNQINRYGQQLSTGKAINQPSDDPYGTTQSISLTTLQSALNQYNTNLGTAKNMLNSSENALNSASTIMQSAYSLAVQSANGTMDQNGRNGIVSQINQIETQLVNLANTQGGNGDYIFAGQKTQTQPFTVSAGALVYNGDNNNIVAQTGPNQSMVINTQASNFFTTAYAQLESFKNDLSGGTVGAISSTDISNLQNTMDTVNQMRGQIGAQIQAVTSMTTANTTRINDLTTQLSNINDTDIAAVTVKYQAAQAAYQGAITVASKGFNLGLMQYITPAAA